MSMHPAYIPAYPQPPARCGYLGRRLGRFALLALLALGGCAEPAPPEEGSAQLALRWRFVDGRSCDTSGVSLVFALLEGQELAVAPCAAGVVLVGELPAGRSLVRLEGRSPAGAALYAGELEVSLSAGEARELELPLFFQGGD